MHYLLDIESGQSAKMRKQISIERNVLFYQLQILYYGKVSSQIKTAKYNQNDKTDFLLHKNDSKLNLLLLFNKFFLFFTFQAFASVLIPGGTINLIVRASRLAVTKTALSQTLKKWIPTGVGISSIPLIIHPIDTFVDVALDNTTRKWMFPEKR